MRLRVTQGPHRGATCPLPVNSSVVIGRKKHKGGMQLSLDEEVSTTHCLVRHLADGTLRVEDLGSLNGTRVGENARKVTWAELASGESFEIEPGHCIELGGSVVLVDDDPSAEAGAGPGGGGGSSTIAGVTAGLATARKSMTARGAITTGKKTAVKRRSKSPVAFSVATTPSPPSLDSPIPLDLDPPSPIEVEIPTDPAAQLVQVSRFPNWAPLSKVVSVDLPSSRGDHGGLWQAADHFKDISSKTAWMSLAEGGIQHSQCWWVPSPWAVLTLELPECVWPSAVRISVLVNGSSSVETTSSPMMIPSRVVVSSSAFERGGEFVVDELLSVSQDIALVELSFARDVVHSCAKVMQVNVSTRLESAHGACVHKLEIFGDAL